MGPSNKQKAVLGAWTWPSCQLVAPASPGLTQAPHSVFLMAAPGPAQAGAGAWGLATCSLQPLTLLQSSSRKSWVLQKEQPCLGEPFPLTASPSPLLTTLSGSANSVGP